MIDRFIGRTPVVQLSRVVERGCAEVWVKLEGMNPGGSIKDRPALAMILDAERKGLLSPGQTIVEPTSGNTGIGLAMVCAQKVYPLVVTMAESFSIERRRMMRFLGAKVVLTPAELKGSGMLAKATELAQKHGWFLCRQFENEANADAHSRTTAPEILADFDELDGDGGGAGQVGQLFDLAADGRFDLSGATRPGAVVAIGMPRMCGLVGLVHVGDVIGRVTERVVD